VESEKGKRLAPQALAAAKATSMKISIDPVLSSRINAAWKQLTPDQQRQLGPRMLSANQQAVAVAQTRKAPSAEAAPHHLVLAHSALSNDSDGVVAGLEAGIVIDVGPDGAIWGTGKYDGSSATNRWKQVMSAFPAGNGPAYWYWGHVHAGVVYEPKSPGDVLCRCLGHGALPWGHASELAGNPNVKWYENRSANDPDIPQRVLNGFAMLYLDGPKIQEVFYDENGGVAVERPGGSHGQRSCDRGFFHWVYEPRSIPNTN
jgi:hypothetical protein